MSDVPQTRRCARPSGRSISRSLCGALVVLALACEGTSLEDYEPPGRPPSGSSTGTLPALDSGGDSTGSFDVPPDLLPQAEESWLCAEGCSITLPVDWAYYGVVPPPPPGGREPPPPDPDPDPVPPIPELDARGHRVPAMLRDPDDGSLLLAEQHDGFVTLHRLDRDGRLEWNVPLLLPCDVCDLGHIARLPSGDLLLSAAGMLVDGGPGLIAARYDPVAQQTIWASTVPTESLSAVPVRSGEITALDDSLVAQLYLVGFPGSFTQRIEIALYGEEGLFLEHHDLVQNQAMPTRRPLLLRTTDDGELLVQLPYGNAENAYGLTGLLMPPIWDPSGFTAVPVATDALRLLERGHARELGHIFDGARTHLVLADRVRVEPDPRWITSLAFDSTTPSRAALAVDPEGEVYVAVRTTQALGEQAEPLVGLSLARFGAAGELRWRTTLLDRIDETHHPLELAVDDDEGLVVATVVDDQLRVERRIQQCECG